MQMDPEEAAQSLLPELGEGRLAVLIGSGVSGPYVDPGGREYGGLPSPREFVDLAATLYPEVVKPESGFEEACDAIVRQYGRRRLEERLVATYSTPAAFEGPPAPGLLAGLPFAAYITSNYDELLEHALDRLRRRHSVIVQNDEMSRYHNGVTPVIKYHGSVLQPSSLVATSEDVNKLEESRRIVRQLISVTLANKSLLVSGHGMRDGDLARVLRDLLGDLGEYAPRVVLVRPPEDPGVLPSQGYQIVEVREDTTQFLRRVERLARFAPGRAGGSMAPGLPNFVDSTFFTDLQKATVLPSETQVIDAFLGHLRDELGATSDVPNVAREAGAAVEVALAERRNYRGLERVWSDLQPVIAAAATPADAEATVTQAINIRHDKIHLFARAGARAVEPGSRILLYSQSQRVMQYLRGVPVATQRTCDIFISECRPKSPLPYQDAEAICHKLADSYYRLTVCPDVVALNLLAMGQITSVLLGTHAVYREDDGTPYAFVNTCGSLSVELIATQFGVPVVVVAEDLKLETVPMEDADDHYVIDQEHDLATAASGLAELRSRREPVRHLNVGYELVRVNAPYIEVVVPDAVEDS